MRDRVLDGRSDFLELVERARAGDEASLDRLAKAVEGRLCAYVYRLTLDEFLAQDLMQETLLEMVKSLKKLKQPERFWGWLYGIAPII